MSEPRCFRCAHWHLLALPPECPIVGRCDTKSRSEVTESLNAWAEANGLLSISNGSGFISALTSPDYSCERFKEKKPRND